MKLPCTFAPLSSLSSLLLPSSSSKSFSAAAVAASWASSSFSTERKTNWYRKRTSPSHSRPSASLSPLPFSNSNHPPNRLFLVRFASFSALASLSHPEYSVSEATAFLSSRFFRSFHTPANECTVVSETRRRQRIFKVFSGSRFYSSPAHSSPIRPESSSPPSPAFSPPLRIFSNFSVYKGKSALQASPVLPTFKRAEDRLTGEPYVSLEREGVLMLEFANSFPRQPQLQQSKAYDWGNKIRFQLSVSELGQLMVLGEREKAEFFHDSMKGSDMEGKITKSLKIEPMERGGGFFFSIALTDKIRDVSSRCSVPVSLSEVAILKSLCNYLLPYLLGWNALLNDPSTCVLEIASIEQEGERERNRENEMGGR